MYYLCIKTSCMYYQIYYYLEQYYISIPVIKLKYISCPCFTKGFLAQCDTMEGNISQEIDKLHSKNLALAK